MKTKRQAGERTAAGRAHSGRVAGAIPHLDEGPFRVPLELGDDRVEPFRPRGSARGQHDGPRGLHRESGRIPGVSGLPRRDRPGPGIQEGELVGREGREDEGRDGRRRQRRGVHLRRNPRREPGECRPDRREPREIRDAREQDPEEHGQDEGPQARADCLEGRTGVPRADVTSVVFARPCHRVPPRSRPRSPPRRPMGPGRREEESDTVEW